MLKRHLTRCLIAGFVALLPVGGLVLTIAYLEYTISDTGLATQWFYFPGLGLIAVTLLMYLIGLIVTTFVGRWVFAKFDLVLGSLPGFGTLYSTLKQILGYGEGKDAIFQHVVYVENSALQGDQIGLVTERLSHRNEEHVAVFMPGAPNPAAGQLVLLPRDRVRAADLTVDAALKALVSIGKSGLTAETPR